MSAPCELITFLAPTVTGIQSITGFSFNPVALVLMTVGLTADGKADGWSLLHGVTDGVLQSCQSADIEDNSTTPKTAQCSHLSAIYQRAAVAASGTPTVIQQATWNAWTTGGFDLNWTVVDGVQTVIYAIGFGGVGVEAEVRQVLVGPYPTVQTITDLSGTPELIITLPGTQASAPGNVRSAPAAQVGGLGFSTGTKNLGLGMILNDTLGGQCDPKFWATQIECGVHMLDHSVFYAFADALLKCSNFTPVGFDASVGGVGGNPFYHTFLVLRGLGGVTIGWVSEPTTPTTKSLLLPSDPAVVLFNTCGADNVAAFSPSHTAAYCLGIWDQGGGVRHATTSLRRPASTSIAAREQDDDVPIRLLTPAASGASSPDETVAVVTAAGRSLQFTTVSGWIYAYVHYVAFGAVAGNPPPATFEGTTDLTGVTVPLHWVEANLPT